MRPPNKRLPLDPDAVARIRAKPLPITPTERWRAMAILQEPLLEDAEWVRSLWALG